MKLSQRQREATAYHEAGHAVVAQQLGIHIRSVSIVPVKDSAGRVEHRNPLAGISFIYSDTPRARIRSESLIMMALAGPLAQKRWRPKSWRGWHGNGDFTTAWELASRYCAGDESISAYLKWLDIQTTARLTSVWEWVEVVAAELIAREEILGARVPELLIEKAIPLRQERLAARRNAEVRG